MAAIPCFLTWLFKAIYCGKSGVVGTEYDQNGCEAR